MNKLFIIIRRTVYSLLGTPSLFGFVKKPQITVLCYHSISNDGWRFSTKISDFKKQMMLLSKHYDFITVDNFKKFLKGTYEPKRPSLLLTFDDGYKNLLGVADFLKKMKIQPVLFVIGDSKKVNRKELDTNLELLSVAEVKKLISFGWTIGSHTNSHPDMRSEKIHLDEEIARKTGSSISWIAYPKGIYSPKILKAVKKAGYTLGFSMDDELLVPTSNPLTLPRVGIDGTHSVLESIMALQPLSILFRRFVRHSLKISI